MASDAYHIIGVAVKTTPSKTRATDTSRLLFTTKPTGMRIIGTPQAITSNATNEIVAGI
jgi:hypothetical protein